MRRLLLDHGYLEVIEHWGSDERIIEAARMSTSKGFQGWGQDGGVGDEKLLRYLYENRHATPFEMAGMVVEVKAPIMVFREWHRHRTQSYNEMSARYVPLPNENYEPEVSRFLLDPGPNRQAGGISGAQSLGEAAAGQWKRSLRELYEHAETVYQDGLSMGVSKELARLALPVGRYSRMRASANLRNWLAFLTLRMDAKAQWEIRQYAVAITEEIRTIFPRTHQLFWENFHAG